MATKPHLMHVIPTYEYFMAERSDDASLDEYGEEGWELVAVTVIAGATRMRNYYFKRPCVGHLVEIPR